MLLRRLERLPEEPSGDDAVQAFRAAALIQQGQSAAAESLWQAFDHRRPLPVAGARYLAEAYLARGDWRKARRVLQRGLIADVHAPELLQLMARAEATGGRHDRASAYLAHALRRAEPHQAPLAVSLRADLAGTLTHLNHHGLAWQVVAGEDPASLPVGLSAVVEARYQASQGNYAEALARLATAPDTDAVVQTRAQVLLLSGDAEGAWQVLRAAGQGAGPLADLSRWLAEPSGDASRRRARLLLEGATPGRDSPVLQALLAMATGDSDALKRALGGAGLPFAEMIRHTAFLDQLEVSALARQLAIAHFSLDQGYLEQALQHARAMQVSHPKHVLPAMLTVEVLRRQGDLRGAVEASGNALALLPGSVALRFQLAQALAGAGDTQAALAEYREMLEEQPDFVAGQLAYGELLSRQGSWQEAGEAWAWALNFKPEAVPLLLAHARAQTEIRQGELPAATLAALAGLALPPGELSWLRGRAAQLRGEPALAAEELFAAVQADPRPEWLQSLAAELQRAGGEREASQLDCQAALLGLTPSDWRAPPPQACVGE